MNGFIYKVTCTINNKSYIGKTKQDIDSYIEGHFQNALKNSPTRVFYRAIQKHGRENFIYETLYEGPVEMLNEMECFYIQKYHTYLGLPDCCGYNMTMGGDGGDTNTQHPMKSEIYSKVSKSNKGRIWSEEHKANMKLAQIKRYSIIIKKPRTPKQIRTTKQKQIRTIRIQARNPNRAVFGSKEHIDKMQRPKSDEHKRKMSEVRKIKGLAKGKNNPKAGDFLLTSPSGETFELHGELSAFCLENKLPFTTMIRHAGHGIIKFKRKLKDPSTANCEGWEINRI